MPIREVRAAINVRLALRALFRFPFDTAVAIVSLALGIGANSAMFELVNVVRLRSLPVADPGTLVEVRTSPRNTRSGNFTGRRPELTFAQWQEISAAQQAFSGIFAWGGRAFNISPRGEMRRVEGMYVSGGFFSVLGVQPLAGRLFTAQDDRPGCASPGVVLSYGFWQREFGGRPVLGRPMTVDGHTFDVVGITPLGFFGLEVGRSFDIALPLCAEPILAADQSATARLNYWWLGVIGRLKPGWTREQASANLNAISPAVFSATLPAVYDPDERKDYLALTLTAEDASAGISSLRTQYDASLLLLLGITALVLLIACANLANLMLARATAREREIAVRLAIGASRPRVIRQLLAESIVLAVAGTAAGALLARWLSRLLVTFITTDRTPVFLDFSLDWRMFAFTAALAVTACLLFGLAPAIRATRTAPAEAMKAGGRGQTVDRGRSRLRRGLVGAQVALTLVLLIGALLFGRSLQKVLHVATGVDDDGVILADVDLPGDVPARRHSLTRQLLDRIRQSPGVDAAVYAWIVPLSGSGDNTLITAEGVAVQPKDRLVNLNYVSEGFFSLLKMRLVRGRDIDARDTLSSPLVAVVNETLARQFFGEENPIGKTFRMSADAGEPEPVYEIVGVVSNAMYRSLREGDVPIAYLSLAQQHELRGLPTYFVRSTLPTSAATAGLKQAIAEVNPDIVIQFGVLAERIRELSLRDRLVAMLSGSFGALAVVLSIVGVYGVMSYIVARRRHEIGIRMALGASRRQVSGLVLSEVTQLIVVGLVCGLLLAFAAARTASTLLFNIDPGDPVSFATAAVLLAATGLLAGYVPARRAARIEPLAALRQD
jgi:putative ABC transport system permease protein